MRILGEAWASTAGAASAAMPAAPACSTRRREVHGVCRDALMGNSLSSLAGFDVAAPAAQMRDVFGALERQPFAQESLHPAAVGQRERADAERDRKSVE